MILLGAYAAYFIVFVLHIAAFAVFRWGWTSYISNFSDNLFIPAAMFCGLFVFGFLTVAFPEKPIVIPEEDEKKEEGESEEAKEEASEAPVEEKAESEDDGEFAFAALKPFDDSAAEGEEAAEAPVEEPADAKAPAEESVESPAEDAATDADDKQE